MSLSALVYDLYFLTKTNFLLVGHTNENDQCAHGYTNQLLQEEEIEESSFPVL